MTKQQMRLRFIEGGEGGGGNPPAPEANSGSTEPVQLPADHPLVTTLASQKTTIADLKSKATEAAGREAALQAQVDGAGQQVAGKVREALIASHHLADDAAALITGTTPEDVVKQVTSVLALSGTNTDLGPQAPLAGTSATPKPDENSAFAKSLFSGE